MQDDLKRLREFTRGCREDMHEPDEQDVDAEFGPRFRFTAMGADKTSFDNASVPNPDYPDPYGQQMERMDMGFWLVRDGKHEWFNLANIIALARKAVL